MELEFGKTPADIFSTTEKGVGFILKDNLKARDDDMYLAFVFWKEIQGIKIPEEIIHEIINRGTAFETISRSRRLLQEKGLYPASAEAFNRRRAREQEVLDAVRKRKELF